MCEVSNITAQLRTLGIMGDGENHSVMSDSLQPHGLYRPRNSPGQNTGVGSLSLLQGIFPAQGLNPGLPLCLRILYQLSHKGSPERSWVYPNHPESGTTNILFHEDRGWILGKGGDRRDCLPAQSLQSCLTLCDPMDCNPPGSSVHGILQARILEWDSMPSSRGSSSPKYPTRIFCVSCIAGDFFIHWATWKAQVVLVIKNPPVNVGGLRDMGSIPGSRISPGGENGNPFQYCCLENSMDRGVWRATVHRVTESDTTEMTTDTHTHRRDNRNLSPVATPLGSQVLSTVVKLVRWGQFFFPHVVLRFPPQNINDSSSLGTELTPGEAGGANRI